MIESVPSFYLDGERTGNDFQIEGPGIAGSDFIEPGIERYVSRRMLVDYWEGGIPGVAARASTEYVFQVKIIGSLESYDQAAQRAANALQLIGAMYNEWGVQESSASWAKKFKDAADANRQLETIGQKAQPLPLPPKMRFLAKIHCQKTIAKNRHPLNL